MASRTGAVDARSAAAARPRLPRVAAVIADAERNWRRVVFIRIASTLSLSVERVKAKTGICCGFAPIEISYGKTRLF